MNRASVHQQLHGYRNGHQLLSTSVALDVRDQDVVDRLSDLSGRLRPDQVFEPYLTTYPLPSRSHYVVARTFQDLEAPRSGCVLTRSVLIPMPVWVGLRTMDWVLALLMAVEPGEEVEAFELPGFPEAVALPEVSDPRVEELVQALFLEDERPVVVFDAPEAELIANRLLVALWPALRSRFSTCTLALGPRRVDEREFDVVFTPASASSRFERDVYRRIGARGSVLAGAAHRWAGPTAAEIFRSGEPSLVTKDPLGLLAGDDRGDRSAVRMVLLWHELASRASTTPTAVLGMLDILNSRDGPGADGWPGVFDTVVGAIELAAEGFPAREAWEFLLALDGKLAWESAPGWLAAKVEDTARVVACGNAEQTLCAVETQWAGAERSRALGRGLADGIAASAEFAGLSGRLDGLDPDLLLRLADLSELLREAMASEVGRDSETWAGVLERALRGGDAQARQRVRRNVVAAVDETVGGRWFARLLTGAADSELAEMAVEAGCAERLGANGLTEALVAAARSAETGKTVREAVVDRVPDEAADGFVLQLLAVSKTDVGWLLEAVAPRRAGRMLMVLLASADDAAVRSVMHGRLAHGVLSVLQKAMPSSVRGLARILALDVVEADVTLDLAFEVAEALAGDERTAFEAWIVDKALSVAGPVDARVGKVVEAFGAALSGKELVRAATAAWIPWQRLAANLVVLDGAPAQVREGVIGAVDLLSQRLRRRSENLGADAYGAWARLLRDVDDEQGELRIGASGTALGYALRKVSYPVSELVVVSFATVYAEIVRVKALGAVGGDVRALSSYFRLSWKKAKEGRGDLIDALVGAFLRSSWPPADLVLAAMDAGIERKVVSRLRRRFLGRAYLEKVHRDTGRLEEELRRRVRRCLENEK